MIKPIGDRVIVTSRGIKEDVGGVVIPEKFLRDSNVCTRECGEVVIIRDRSGYELPNRQRIIENEDVIAKIVDGNVVPLGEYVLVRKCIDPEEVIITSVSDNKSRFAEILAVGEKTMLQDDIGMLAYVENINHGLQKVEETEADWLLKESSILMVVEPEE